MSRSRALLLVDVQEDYLQVLGLRPHRQELCARLERLLEGFRAAGQPVVHVWTTVTDPERAMPHWRTSGIQRCISGTVGHLPPERLRPRPGETVVHKTHFSGFADPALASALRARGVDTVVLAGLYLRACVRSTALDAYQHGFAVELAEEALGDDDPLHGAITRFYLQDRVAPFRSTSHILEELRATPPREFDDAGLSRGFAHLAPRDRSDVRFTVSAGGAAEVVLAVDTARAAQGPWHDRSIHERKAILSRLAALLREDAEPLALGIALDTGKPIAEARLEVRFGVDLIESAVGLWPDSDRGASGPGWQAYRRPHGLMALVSPWNNPLAIPMGKVAPALLAGNAVLWKPALPGTGIARTLQERFGRAGLPAGLVTLLEGDHRTAERLIQHPAIEAVTLTGSIEAGAAALALCARRNVPFQGELGGNNAAIVWGDADLASVASQIAAAGFGSAGQRCTANRRVIVEASIHDAFVAALSDATRALRWGDPLEPATQIGPVISARILERIAAQVERAVAGGARAITPHPRQEPATGLESPGFYYPPTLILCGDPDAEIVQEETFGPVVVVQPARDWDQALALCNGVAQGLAAALFSPCADRQRDFLQRARAGILKLDQATAGARADAPFGGWKASGVGAPEHGVADLEFHTRWQTVYRA